MTQVQLAAAVGVSEDTVYAWESGRSTPRGANMSALIRVLEKPKSILRGDSESPPTSDSERAIRAAQRQPHQAGSRTQRIREWLAEFRLELTKAGADDDEISEAMALLQSPEVYTFYVGGQRQEFSEDDVLKGMRAIAHLVRLELRDRGRNITVGRAP